MEIKHILCPVDLSDVSRHALEHAIALARWYGARLSALHVCDPGFPPVPDLVIGPSRGGAVISQEEISQRSQQLSALLTPASADVTTDVHVDVGNPADTIIEHANKRSVDLIAMGTHGHGGFEHFILGSVAEKVLRKARCPVLTVPPRARATSKLPFKRLLCPVDFSDASLMALRFAFSLAQESDAELTILHVVEDLPLDDEGIGVDQAFADVWLQRERRARDRIDELVPGAARDWCDPVTRVARGKPYREILGVATEDSIDLIVLGVHGRNALDLALFGSTTNHVVRSATCPVLTVRK